VSAKKLRAYQARTRGINRRPRQQLGQAGSIA
jgi:hypothetical protein